MNKINCWEYWKCGREIGGTREQEMGACPVVKNYTHSGRNSGRVGGRICWEVFETFCHLLDGTHAKELMNCMQCDFFILVKSEEGEAFVE